MASKTAWKVATGAAVVALVVGVLLTIRDRPPVTPITGAGTGESEAERVRRSGGSLRPPQPAETKPGAELTAHRPDEPSTQTAAASSGPQTTDTASGGVSEEAETQARERYELAQLNAYKFRKTDPSKVQPAELAPALSEAAKKHEIPQDLLTALMLVESGGSHREADHSMEGGFGVMNLKENNLVNTLSEAANLIGRTEDEVLYDQKVNIEAGAALLARYYEDAVASGLEGGDAWYMAVSQYSGRPNPELAAALADEVAGMMMRGMETELHDGGGTVRLPANPEPVFYPKNWRLAGVTPPPTPTQGSRLQTETPGDLNASQAAPESASVSTPAATAQP